MSLAQQPEDELFAEGRSTIAGNFRALAGRKRASQTEIAAAMGRSQPYVSRRMNGEVPMDTDDLLFFARYFGVDLAELLEDVRSRCFSLALVPPLDGQQGQLDLGLPPLGRADLQVVVP